MRKETIDTIHRKNTIINNIIDALVTRKNFLILGHKNPDEDCVASMVSIALLISKFNKDVTVYLPGKIHEHFNYLINICTYNAIKHVKKKEDISDSVDTIIICDTPKPSMVDTSRKINQMMKDDGTINIEIDHHIGSDSRYIGDPEYSLVTEASSACELVGLIALKLRKKNDILERFNISTVFSRNIVLSILTGIIGDSNMGQFLKTRREKKYYDIFSRLYNELLEKKTTKESNFRDMKQVFDEIQRLSSKEEKFYNIMIEKKQFSRSFGYVVFNNSEMKELKKEFDRDTVVSVSRSVADILAEESGGLSLVVFDDVYRNEKLVQFRVRRSTDYKVFDVRNILDIFSIENGGGHEGAIGFRIRRDDLPDLDGYVEKLIAGVEEVLP